MTASGDRFLVTSLAPGEASGQRVRRAGRPYLATEVYELTGPTENLREYVGWQVRVNGEAPPRAITIVQERSPAGPASPAAVGTAGQSPPEGKDRLQVSTEQQTRFEMTQLRVLSVTPIRNVCVGGAG